MNSPGLDTLIRDCLKKNRRSQKELYKLFFGYSVKICYRYAHDKEAAVEIVNDGFMKVFTKLHLYDTEQPFKTWLGRIMINTAIDHYRTSIKRQNMENLDNTEHVKDPQDILSALNYNDIIRLVQKLSVAYRAVFNLFVIDGYSHAEIASMLAISEGTSKSNLFKAREKLKQMITELEKKDIKILEQEKWI